MELYENIKKYRKELGMSQEELAKKTGYTDRSSIAKIEQGKVDLSIDKIGLFAKAFGITASELMGNDGIDFEHPELDAEMTNDLEFKEMWKKYSVLSEEQKSSVRVLVESYYRANN